MNLRETIRRILKEDTKQEVLNFIDEFGISRAVSFFGGDVLKDILGDDMTKETKIEIIKEFFHKWGGMNIFELMAEPIHIKEVEKMWEGIYDVHQIEFLNDSNVVVQVRNGYDNSIKKYADSEYYIRYENLDDDIIDKIFEIIM